MNTNRPPRIVWITGASSGIGRALADAFVRGGDSVIATSRSVARLRAATNRLNRLGVVEILPCDVRRAGDVSRVARFIQRRHKKIDLLVNNAGVTAFKEFARTSLKEFDEILQSNLRGLFLTTHAILPLMMRRKRGTILNILSYAAKTTYTKSAAYSAAKAGSAAMMNSLRAEVRGKGINVVNIYPGAILTPMWPRTYQRRFGSSMMKADEFAQLIFQLTLQPETLHIEEIVVRPRRGDLQV